MKNNFKMTAPSDAEDTPIRRSIFRNLSNTAGYAVNTQQNLFCMSIFFINHQIEKKFVIK